MQTKPDAGFFVSGKISDDRREGVYAWYMTEWLEKAGEAINKKDASGAGMGFFVDVQQPLIGQMRIDLRRSHVGMAQQLLHRAKVSATEKQACCK
jgi:hypothetical protein